MLRKAYTSTVCFEEDLGDLPLEEEDGEAEGVWVVDEVVSRGCPNDLLTYDEAINITAYVCTPDGWHNPDPCVAGKAKGGKRFQVYCRLFLHHLKSVMFIAVRLPGKELAASH